MKKKRSVQACLLPLVIGMLLAGYALAQEEGQPQWIKKAEAVEKELAKFVPAPVAGITDRTPWKNAFETRTDIGCGESGDCELFAPYRVERQWFFEDPALLKQAETAYKALDAHRDAYLQRYGQGTAPRQEAEKYSEQYRKLEDRARELANSFRSLVFGLDGNQTPEWCSGGLGSPVRSGTLKGYPLYRYTGKDEVCLAVFLGPAGFRNPPLPASGELRPELKTVLVKAMGYTTPQSAKADEAILRQLLEKVDYDGLAKLLTP